MSVTAAYIFDVSAGRPVAAELHDQLSVEALLDIEGQWGPARYGLRKKLRAAGLPEAQWPESLHWNWGTKSVLLSLLRRPDEFRVFAIQRQAVWEGAMVTLKGTDVARLQPDRGQPLIYLDYLEAAPWNWTVRDVGQQKKFKAVGSVLLAAAVAQSVAEGLNGRLGLHSLPSAEAFYLGQGLKLVAHDAPKRMNYFELTAEAAERLLKGGE